ncbi:MAG: hypothetical protein AAGI15_05110 [Pseudomonadota bacterium]
MKLSATIQGMLIITLLTAAVAARAGLNFTYPVWVSNTGSGGTATGQVRGARNSSNNIEFIYCYFEVNDVWKEGRINCSAQSATEERLSCYKLAPSAAMRAAATSVTDISAITFRADEHGVCTTIGVDNASWNL